MADLFTWFTANWGEIIGTIAGFILVFDRLAKLTPSDADNKAVAWLYKIFAVLGVKVPDVKAQDVGLKTDPDKLFDK